jgi:hypothetical protein
VIRNDGPPEITQPSSFRQSRDELADSPFWARQFVVLAAAALIADAVRDAMLSAGPPSWLRPFYLDIECSSFGWNMVCVPDSFFLVGHPNALEEHPCFGASSG